LILASQAMRQAHSQVVEAAKRGSRVLLIGPSGAGKEGLARCYHRNSGRGGPLVALNCAMFTKEFLRTELFGAEQGAFTGAVRRIVGAVERAGGGTLFLDEVGEMAMEVQPMLLRFLDHGEYERVGSYGQARSADVRLVCATNKDLRTAIMRGEFRADLWYRLSHQVVEVPPLRERFEDVVAFLRARQVEGRSYYDLLTSSAHELLRAHAWQGNFRELSNFAARLPTLAKAGQVDARSCRALLQEVALVPLREQHHDAPASRAIDSADWIKHAVTAAEAFAEDYQKAAPTNWDEVKDYVEKYFKPLIFCHLTGVDGTSGRESLDDRALGRRLDADRGTATKHINRFFDRFAKK
jgi:DNA-binding NtrC family response regulator